MRVFVTGATGFIGSAIVPELLAAGHQVLGLTRSDEGAKALIAAGAEVHRGDLENLQSLRTGAASVDAVIHAAFNHDFSKFAENSTLDRLAIEAIGDELARSSRPFIVTAGLPTTPGRPATEDDEVSSDPADTPRRSEQAAMSLLKRGVQVCVMRLPQVHDRNKQGLASYLSALARDKGISAYAGDGNNRWSAVHLRDAASLYRLALEKGHAGAKYHAVAEEGVPLHAVAEAIARGLKIPVVGLSPEEAARHFGGLSFAATMDAPATSILTQQRLGWFPAQGAGLMEDLEHASEFNKPS
ncbi:SDR family oxidoreductase [Massilia sp. CMS3.1]|uniref:SDR family oxidoreductase n=1 Tax=Massilia sp. CMS3.1 TaxID=3373083 RepID=UPI003EE6C733